MTIPETLFLIAGRGRYPSLLIESARASGVKKICVAAFEGETSEAASAIADEVYWLRVGQLGKLLDAAKKSGARHAMMAGQLAPANLFDLRPDLRALILLARLKRRNAETLFGEVANQLAKAGLELLNAMTFLDAHVAHAGHMAGPRLKPRDMEDIRFGFDIAKEISRLNIGQAAIVKTGTVLAVEAFEGTNECIRRGGSLARKDAVLVKVTKPNQDMRFDVPVIGEKTIAVGREAKLKIIACEANCTLLLDSPAVCRAASKAGITLYGISE
ncbi:MAG TPA: UDP-2,3-diacylglucosamine diphosphatase LpxI [Terrimicrobiaceae bacterium]